MNIISLSFALFAGALLSAGCQKEATTAAPADEICAVDAPIQDKVSARTALLGDWRWQQTRYPGRGRMTGVVPVETPVSTRHERLFRFTANRSIILEAGQVVQDLPYDVKFWGEGTNAVDPVLLVHAYRSATHSSASILRIDQSGLCLELINSYGDAGGDLNLKKIDRK